MSTERSPFARPGADPGPESDDEPPAYAPARRAAEPAPDQPTRARRAADPPTDEPADEPAGEPTWTPDEATPVRRSRPALWLVVIVLALALLVGGALFVRSLTSNTPKPSGAADRAVAYLQAIAAGDATGALAMSFNRPTGPLISNEALARSRPQLTDIRVLDAGSGDPAGTDVVLGYRARGKEVRGTFPVFQNPQGQWQLRRGAVQLRLAPTPKMIPLTVDGARMDSTGYTYLIDVFPGVHTLSTGSKWLEYSASEFVVEGLGTPPTVDATARPTPAYAGALQQRISERVKGCVASTELAPKGCPWARRANPDQPVRPGSVRYTLLEERYDAPAPGQIDAIAHGAAPMRIRVTSMARVSGVHQNVTEEFDVPGRFAVDLLSQGPDFAWE
ncbi:hypothetical protein HJ590_00170 [Naumannella sp. ID2617S]|nr:hypothetical protein [Naumannella sp. ID2617S]